MAAKKMTQDQFTVVLEDIQDKFETIVEATKPIPEMKQRLDATFEEVGNLKEDVEIVKEGVKEHSRVLKEHARSLGKY